MRVSVAEPISNEQREKVRASGSEHGEPIGKVEIITGNFANTKRINYRK